MIRNQKNRIEIFTSTVALNKSAADQIINIANQSIAERGKFVLCLSGGNTPKSLYALLSAQPYLNLLPWKNTFVFWGDERCVPADDDRSNSHMAMKILLKKTSIPFYNIFLVPVQSPPAEAAKKYEETLKIFFGIGEPSFDLILLGLGENGHTASLFPGTPVLLEESSWVKEVFVQEQNIYRVTMTAPLINKAHHIFFLVTGEEKSNILKIILTAPYEPEKYPAQLINPAKGEVIWFADEKAAANL